MNYSRIAQFLVDHFRHPVDFAHRLFHIKCWPIILLQEAFVVHFLRLLLGVSKIAFFMICHDSVILNDFPIKVPKTLIFMIFQIIGSWHCVLTHCGPCWIAAARVGSRRSVPCCPSCVLDRSGLCRVGSVPCWIVAVLDGACPVRDEASLHGLSAPSVGGTTNTAHGTTNTDARVGIGMKRGDSKIWLKKLLISRKGN